MNMVLFLLFSTCRFPLLAYLVNIHILYGFIVLLVLFFFHAIHNIKCSWSRFCMLRLFLLLSFFLVISIDLCATAYNDQKKPNGGFLLTSQSLRTQISSIPFRMKCSLFTFRCSFEFMMGNY